MADLSEVDRKTQLVAELDRARDSMSRNWAAARRSANPLANFKKSVRHHKEAWIGGAAIAGWVLARLPARRKKVKVVVDRDDRQLKRIKSAGALLGLFKLLLPLAKPAITAYLTQKLTAEKLKEEGVVRTRR